MFLSLADSSTHFWAAVGSNGWNGHLPTIGTRGKVTPQQTACKAWQTDVETFVKLLVAGLIVWHGEDGKIPWYDMLLVILGIAFIIAGAASLICLL